MSIIEHRGHTFDNWHTTPVRVLDYQNGITILIVDITLNFNSTPFLPLIFAIDMNLHPVGEILDNQVLLIALCSSLTAQILKLFIELAQFRQLRFKIMFETGGMPSSHSALVSALATGIGRTQGWDTPQFAIATVFAFIVMYDAAGIRRAAGKQAKVLNQIMVEVFEEEHDPLKELLGHTPVQVVAGSILGILLMWWFL